jgi:hypothetical protein
MLQYLITDIFVEEGDREVGIFLRERVTMIVREPRTNEERR